ncbi:MAG TPA: glycolate oxidase subunit GlcE [Sphingobium sp.]|nr:glycolate oxidase subunit GlcE [Sphingobium sp.]
MMRPDTIDQLCDIIRDARAAGGKLAIRGGGSKAGFGAPTGAPPLDMSAFTGIVDYDPAELVLTVRAGTPLAEVEAALAAQGQMLAFEPWDHGPLFGQAAGRATIGGIVVAGVAGSRRLSAGGARDHLLGFTAVSGKGERFVAGGRVVKNVTGFDLAKLMAGSWGRLAAITELSIKVLPRPRESTTLAAEELCAPAALALMLRALGSPASIAAAAHHPARTLLRLEGFGPSVEARCDALIRLAAPAVTLQRLPEAQAAACWQALCGAASLDGPLLWRIHLPASAAAALADWLAAAGARWLIDWGGALLWTDWAGDPATLRNQIAAAGGHAALVRAPADLRARVPALHPRAPGVAALETRVRRAFDPDGVFETDRFGTAL